MALDYQSRDREQLSGHDHAYTTLLGVFCFLLVLGVVSLTWMIRSPAVDEQGKSTLGLGRAIAICYLVPCVAVLVVRIALLAKRRSVTKWLNIVLLFYAPFGTALA